MALDDRFRQGSLKPPKLGTSPGSSRLSSLGSSQRRQQLQQQRSVREAKKPPEPLRRAVADCLSSSAPHPHGNASLVASEAGRTLRDYIASPAIDIAYSVLLEHTLAERDRSPAVVSRCVALLKCYLLRYIPNPITLRQIDVFCANLTAECESVSTRRVLSWSKTSPNSASALSPASNYASPSLLKSITYVRSLVSRHIPKLYFPQVSFSGDSGTLRQSLPSLSSLLSRSFTSQLSPDIVNSPEPSRVDIPTPSALNLSNGDNVDGVQNSEYISLDLIKWRWRVDDEDRSASSVAKSSGVLKPPDVRSRGFLEIGAASLLLRDLEKGQYQAQQQFENADLPNMGQLLQPSTITTATSFASAHNHLKAITASKRMKPSPHQVWDNIAVSTFHPRARPLFQYRYYSEQQPLRLNPAEVSDVIAAVCLEYSPGNSNSQSVIQLSNPSGKPTTDVAVSVLIKLVIDMYIMDSKAAASLTLFMLEELLSSSRVVPRVRAFDIILNLGIHAQLLEPILNEDPPNLEESSPKELCSTDDTTGIKNVETNYDQNMHSAVDDFESWLLVVLCEVLLFLVQKEEKEEGVWASSLSCLLYYVCDNGRIRRKRLEGLDIRVVKTLLEISREHSWAETVHSKLICILTNMFYQPSDTSKSVNSEGALFLAEQVDILGGIDFICLEYAQANLREEKQNLFLVLLDYTLHQINASTIGSGGYAYNFDEIQPLAAMLILANAPEAFYISIRHGVEGIGEILKRSILPALSSSSNYERISLLLEKITKTFDATLSSFTRLDSEFLYMVRITKSYKSLKSIEDGNDVGAKIRFSWSTLHCLLHSDKSACRQNGYIWLVELLLFGITEGVGRDICSNIKNLQQQIAFAGSQDLNCLSVPLHVSLMCGLLKSKHNFVRWGFLFVLEKLLMRCKLLLDENKVPIRDTEESARCDRSYSRLEIANTLVDMMTGGLALLVQINETDRINILKMCELLFSQLSLRFLPEKGTPCGDIKGLGDIFEYANENNASVVNDNDLQRAIGFQDEFLGSVNLLGNTASTSHVYESASMAASLLRGSATVPIQLVARVPSSVLYWPLIQLAGAATDDIALGIAVGSKGRANLPGASSDIRAALLLLLIGKCTADSSAFSEVGGKDFFRELLDDTDSRVAYYSSAFLLKKMMTEEPEKYQRLLQNLIFKAQQSNNEKLLENPYLQMRGILQLLSDLGAQL